MRLREAASGSIPVPAWQLSAICVGFPVPGITHVTAGSASTNERGGVATSSVRTNAPQRLATYQCCYAIAVMCSIGRMARILSLTGEDIAMISFASTLLHTMTYRPGTCLRSRSPSIRHSRSWVKST